MIDIDIQKSLGRFNLSLKFSVESNRCVIFGQSGSGKSSLLKMIAGFYLPDAGFITVNKSIFFSSKDRVNLPIQARNVGYLPQEYTLFPNMTIKENIKYGLKKRKKNSVEIGYLAEKFKIRDCLNKYPYQVSGGQKQRAALLRTIVVKPDILLLDEPFSALDRPIREELRELVAGVAESLGIPVIFVTHDLEEAFVFAKEIVVIKNGKVVEFGENNRVFLKPTFMETASLLDFGNIYEIEECRDDSVILKNGFRLMCSSKKICNAEFLCIKPENIMILREDTDNSDKENRVKVTIEKINLRGRYINLVTKTDGGVFLSINIPPHILEKMSLKLEKSIIVSIKRESVVFCRRFGL